MGAGIRVVFAIILLLIGLFIAYSGNGNSYTSIFGVVLIIVAIGIFFFRRAGL